MIFFSNCWKNIYFRKLLKFVPPPSKKCRVVALQNYGALQLLELHEVPTTIRCLLPVRLLDLYVSSVVWVCTYDPSSLFQKNKTVTEMWCDYTLAAVHLILFAGIVALWIRITRVIAFALIRICCLGVDVFKFWCYGDTRTESDTDCWYTRLPLWATGVFQENR